MRATVSTPATGVGSGVGIGVGEGLAVGLGEGVALSSGEGVGVTVELQAVSAIKNPASVMRIDATRAFW